MHTIVPNLYIIDIPELLLALPTTITSIPPSPSAIRQLMSMLPEVTNISRNIISTVVEILNLWKGRHLEDLQDGLMDSLKELISAIKSDPHDAVIKVGEHITTIFVYWWKLQIFPGEFFTLFCKVSR